MASHIHIFHIISQLHFFLSFDFISLYSDFVSRKKIVKIAKYKQNCERKQKSENCEM